MTHFRSISFIFLVVATLTVFKSYGQVAVIRVQDAKTGDPVPYAHVCFESVNGGDQLHGLTNDDGEVNNMAKEKRRMPA